MEKINRNIFTCVKIKPVDYDIKMLESEDDQVLKIRDRYKKTGISEHTFEFDRVFDSKASTQDLSRFSIKNCIWRALEGHNCCVVSSGVNGSGKSFSLYGDYSKQLHRRNFNSVREVHGMIYKTVEYLLDHADNQSEIKDVRLSATCFDIYMEKIRDLLNGIEIAEYDGKRLHENAYENMAMHSNLNRDEKDRASFMRSGLVLGANVAPIKSIGDLEKVF